MKELEKYRLVLSSPDFWKGKLLITLSRLGTPYFLSTYVTASAVRHEVMQLKDSKQLPRKTKVESSAWVNKIACRCGNEFLSKDKISTFVSKLQAKI